jgi:hypothetical protein
MAGRLGRWHWLIGVAAAAGLIPLALAQSGPDPTRPAVDDHAVGTASTGGAEAESVGLQTIIRRKGAKPAAVISGAYVELGGRVGESRLSAVGEDFVVLSGPAGKEVLALTPGIKKQPTTSTKKAGKRVDQSRKSARKEQ